MVGTPQTKGEWREWAFKTRAHLDMPALSALLREQLVQLPQWQIASHILLYLSMPGEISVEELAVSGTQQYYVPRCAPKRRLAIHPYTPGVTPLRSGPFGIREPDPTLVPEIPPETIDLVIVPGLVLSEDGWRIGYGGGYYDRFLPRLRPDCLRVGLFPAELIVPTVPVDPWDARLDIVLRAPTEDKQPTEGSS